jgi:hypothetical protein
MVWFMSYGVFNATFNNISVLKWQSVLLVEVYNYLCNLPITTKVVSSNPVHGEVYSIQHYVMKFVSDFRQVNGFLRQIAMMVTLLGIKTNMV